MNTLPPLISQEESDRKRITPDITGSPPEADEPPRKKLRSKKSTDNFITPAKLKAPEDSKNEEKTKDSPGMKFICKICSVCKKTKELIEKVNSYFQSSRTLVQITNDQRRTIFVRQVVDSQT